MKIQRWRICLTVAVLAMSLAAPAPGQEAGEKADNTRLMRAEIKMLKALYAKQREEVDALRKQIAELGARVQQLQERLTAIGQAGSTPPAAGRPGLPAPEPRVTPVPPWRSRPRPRARPGRRGVRRPRTTYASLRDLLDTIPPRMLAADAKISAEERINLARQASFHYVGQTLAADIVVTPIKGAGRSEMELIGKFEQAYKGGKVTCNVSATFGDAEGEALRKTSAGQKTAFTGKITDLRVAPAPTGRVGGPTVRISLTECKLIRPAGAGETPGAVTTVEALIKSIPAELRPADKDTPEQAKARITKLDAWAKRELVGKALTGGAMVLRVRVDKKNVAHVQLSSLGKGQEAAEYSCFLNAQFAGSEAFGIEMIGQSRQIEFRGKITSAKFKTGASRPRIDLALIDCQVTSAGLQRDRLRPRYPRPGSPGPRYPRPGTARPRYPPPPVPPVLDRRRR